MRYLLIGNGERVSASEINEAAQTSDFILAVDGGVHQLPPDVAPHIVAGDFDSASKNEVAKRFKDSEILDLQDQDQCDLEKCIELCLSRGASKVALLGFCGGRSDHALTTYSVALKYARMLEVTILNGEERIYVFNGMKSGHTRTVTFLPQSVVSIIPFSEQVLVSASDLLWPVEQLTLYLGSRGQSNRAKLDRSTITVSDGLAVVTVFATVIASGQ